MMSTDKIRESMADLWRLSKISFFGIMIVFLVIAGIERFFLPEISGLASGFLLGSFCSLVNLHILGRSFAPVVHTGERGALAVFGALSSMLVMALGVYAVFVWYKHLLLGVAIGVASPALFGFLFAILTPPKKFPSS
jgi:hypothetical protein